MFTGQLLLDCFGDHMCLGLLLVIELEGNNNPARMVPLNNYIYTI